MRKDAEEHAAEDKQKRELVEAKNGAESMCFQLEKLLKENDAALSQADKDAINAAIGKTKEAIATDNLAEIKSAAEQLERASHAMSKAMYEAAAAAHATSKAMYEAAANSSNENSESANNSNGKPKDDDAIDAEFEVK
jgi:molecular chaperone DnaK